MAEAVCGTFTRGDADILADFGLEDEGLRIRKEAATHGARLQRMAEDEAKWFVGGLVAAKCFSAALAWIDDADDAARAARTLERLDDAADAPHATKGWKAGDPITNLTSKGATPSWSTVRRRYWKNQALYHPERYSPSNLERTRKGLAPQRYNRAKGVWESMELHHSPAMREGGLFDFVEVWPDEHRAVDPFRR